MSKSYQSSSTFMGSSSVRRAVTIVIPILEGGNGHVALAKNDKPKNSNYKGAIVMYRAADARPAATLIGVLMQ